MISNEASEYIPEAEQLLPYTWRNLPDYDAVLEGIAAVIKLSSHEEWKLIETCPNIYKDGNIRILTGYLFKDRDYLEVEVGCFDEDLNSWMSNNKRFYPTHWLCVIPEITK